jgi:cystathionine beta-synthase
VDTPPGYGPAGPPDRRDPTADACRLAGWGIVGPVTVHESLLDAVGDTPLIRLRRVTAGLSAEVWVKVEFSNPGGSVKDRAALAMVREAERLGDLQPGGVIVEGSSGNTGVGLAMVAAQHGHRAIVVVPNSIAREKIALLRAYGAQVVPAESKVPREHPEHVNNLARRIAAETPGGWYANQYDNPANPRVHELTTGPEIWEQTAGRVTHLVAGIGTGGTISGTGRYLKQHGVAVVGADPETSVYAGGDGSPYYVESVGHYRHPATVDDIWPTAYDQGVVDRFERIPDRESLQVTLRLAREEGLLVGGSAGTAVAAALRVAAELGPEHLVVAILPDSGRNYLSKYFDDEWMTRLGFLDAPAGPFVRDVVDTQGLAVAHAGHSVGAVLDVHADGLVAVVTPRDSAAPTRSAPEVLGVVAPADLRALVTVDPARSGDDVAAHAGAAPTAVGAGENLAEAVARLDGEGPLLVLVDGRAVALVPRVALEQGPAGNGCTST